MKLKSFNNFINEKYLNDAIGYNIGEYIYHVTPIKNIEYY